MHRRSPHTWLSTVTSLGGVNLSDDAIRDAHGGQLPAGIEPCGASIDLWNGFYQFRVPELGSHFAMGYPDAAAAYGVTEIFCEDSLSYVPVDGSTVVYPVFEGMAMGWAWALHSCHGTICKAGAETGGSLVRDRCVMTTPTVERPLRCPYVDNDNIIGLNKTSVQRTLSEVIGDLTGSGFKVHEQVDATEELNLVGIVFDGRRRTLRLTHRRL